jgi:uncharacterized protein (DUF1697 family)
MATERYAALLRGVNVGGRGKVGMEDLRTLFSDAGLTDVASYVQSGNVVFTSSKRDVTKLSRSIEQKISADLGLEVTVLIRSAAELRGIEKGNPLIGRTDDSTKLHVTFLADQPDPELVAKLPHGTGGAKSGNGTGGAKSGNGTADELTVVGREVYLFCPGGYGNSKLNNTFIEKKLATRATTRNWRTVGKLVEMTA